jgi:hypothetical protein
MGDTRGIVRRTLFEIGHIFGKAMITVGPAKFVVFVRTAKRRLRC